VKPPMTELQERFDLYNVGIYDLQKSSNPERAFTIVALASDQFFARVAFAIRF
jgi:hypothetical protein